MCILILILLYVHSIYIGTRGALARGSEGVALNSDVDPGRQH